MLEHDYQWTSDGASSGGLTAVQIQAGCSQLVLYGQSSTLASTNSFALQSAQQSTGPWFTEGSTSFSATATVIGQSALRLTGPVRWVRPYLNSASTGTYTFRMIAVE